MNSGNKLLDEEEQLLLSELLGERIGLHFGPDRREGLIDALTPRLHALGLSSAMDYYHLLLYRFDAELPKLLPLLAGESNPFFEQFERMQGLVNQVVTGFDGRVKLLSAGCGTGEEAYSLAMAAGDHPSEALIDIDAFDADTNRINKARDGYYPIRSLRAASPEQLRRFFQRAAPERFLVRAPWRHNVNFFCANLVDASSRRDLGPWHGIVCRDVLSLFSPEAVEKTLKLLFEAMLPGGLLLLGHSESLLGLSAGFRAVRLQNCTLYQRPI